MVHVIDRTIPCFHSYYSYIQYQATSIRLACWCNHVFSTCTGPDSANFLKLKHQTCVLLFLGWIIAFFWYCQFLAPFLWSNLWFCPFLLESPSLGRINLFHELVGFLSIRTLCPFMDSTYFMLRHITLMYEANYILFYIFKSQVSILYNENLLIIYLETAFYYCRPKFCFAIVSIWLWDRANHKSIFVI